MAQVVPTISGTIDLQLSKFAHGLRGVLTMTGVGSIKTTVLSECAVQEDLNAKIMIGMANPQCVVN
jgi:hypothetical protein